MEQASQKTGPKPQKHCPGCFQDKGGVAVCASCGYDELAPRPPLFLPHGLTIGGHFRVGRVLGQPGGFGVTYLGWDINLQQRVAIKEFLPRDLATRHPGALEVAMQTDDARPAFEFGKEQFLREARIVARLDHPNVVRVRSYFNANDTAYMVMDYYDGMSLGDYLARTSGSIEPALAVSLIRTVLDALRYVHGHGVVHRDLKPHNIYLAVIGKPILLDFGAARQAAGDNQRSLSVVVTDSYAPVEQYQRRAAQGPWTDVYGAAATLYRMLSGHAPPVAMDRIGDDPLAAETWPGVAPALRPALARALALMPENRFQTAAEFDAELESALVATGGATVAATVPEVPPAAAPTVAAVAPAAPPPMRGLPRWALLALPALAVVGLLVMLLAVRWPSGTAPPEIGDTAAPAASAPAITPAPPARVAAPPAAVSVPALAVTPPADAPSPPLADSAASSPVADPDPDAPENLLEPDFVHLPGGSLLMGDAQGPGHEQPVHRVAIAPFAISNAEITVDQFAQFVRLAGYDNPNWKNAPCESTGSRQPTWREPGYLQSGTRPVVCVSWADAAAYAAWYGKRVGVPTRLPTEAQWEYAARGGSTTPYWWGDGYDATRATCGSCPLARLGPLPVKSWPANGFGLFDTASNVREWTCSRYSAYGAGDEGRCSDLTDSSLRRAVRGGSWREDTDALRSAHRLGREAYRRDVWTGFRIVQPSAPGKR